jgi:hypothetical protein
VVFFGSGRIGWDGAITRGNSVGVRSTVAAGLSEDSPGSPDATLDAEILCVVVPAERGDRPREFHLHELETKIDSVLGTRYLADGASGRRPRRDAGGDLEDVERTMGAPDVDGSLLAARISPVYVTAEWRIVVQRPLAGD